MKTLIISPIIALDADAHGVFTSMNHLPGYEEIVRLRGLEPSSLYSLLDDPTELPHLTEDEIVNAMLMGIFLSDQALVCKGWDRCPFMYRVGRAALNAGLPILSYEELMERDVIEMDNKSALGIPLRRFWDDLNTNFDKHWGWFFNNGYKAQQQTAEKSQAA